MEGIGRTPPRVLSAARTAEEAARIIVAVALSIDRKRLRIVK